MAIPQRSHSAASGFFERAFVSASAAPIAIQGPSANGVAKNEKNADGGACPGRRRLLGWRFHSSILLRARESG